jgi:ferrous iron transport protein B
MRKRLSELKPGESGIIVGFSGGDPILRRRLAEIGMTKGEVVKVLRNAPLKDPVEFRVRGYDLSIKRDEASIVIVEVGNNDTSSGHGSGRGLGKDH